MSYAVREWNVVYTVNGASRGPGEVHRGLGAAEALGLFDKFSVPHGDGCEIWEEDGLPVYNINELRKSVAAAS